MVNRIGEDRHVMTYAIAGGESFNMVLSHVDRSDPATWAHKFLKEDVQKEFEGWDPRYVELWHNMGVTAAHHGNQAYKNHITD